MEFSSPPDPEKENQKVVQKRQNIIFGILLFFGLAAFSLGIFQISGTIGSPFQAKGDSENLEGSLITNISLEEGLTQLKNRDTDQDGVNDYDELYVYNTSPYVRDSDSDGHLDKEEIETNNDPNCPVGQVCQTTQVSPQEEGTSLPAEGELSAQDLRTTLKKLGAPASLVDSMDDQTLREVYRETVAETGITTGELTNESLPNLEELVPEETSSQEITLEALQSLTVPQIRDLLKKSGEIDESVLSQVDDATLETIYRQALGQGLESYTP
ncbi:hypothetical protein KKI23_00385 [Patescibacteria group bacterium]|nr:hypothetical protein [Patescibacteria group bacterium]